ncbi:MAG: polysaccharide deacetylase family protein [Solirubrobacterales bacterium]|jgi:peptidoglycan/xylan/chitin deacetylase (PgdA/CDA1 family)|nr:polysaccharide deacetylase family protein [Solirubrobacterales bacterium]
MTGLSGTFRSGDRARQQIALLVFFLLIVGLAIIIPSNATSADQNPIQNSKLSQKGRSLIVQVRTVQEVNLSKLDRRPDFARANHRYLCLQMNPRGGTTIVRICFGGGKRTYRVLGVSRTSETGKVRSSKVIPAEVKKVDGLKLVATFDPRDAGLPPGNYAWRVASHSGSCPQSGPLEKPDEDCVDYFPPKHRAVYDLRPVRAVGCTGGNGEFVTHGPRGRKRVALTFDDGPSDYTPDVLRILKRKKAKATFFMLGQQVSSYPTYARRVLALGHEVANHSYDHPLLPSGSNIRRANRRIIQVTGFRPCLFRPPYGAVSSSLKADVRAARMKVVNWDVDTSDWKLPGAGSIASTIVHQVRPGSIVLMHDGGGPRGGTVDALSSAISGLRDRGYRLVTVSQLLGNRIIYRPVR